MKRKLSFDEIDQIKSLDQMKLNRQKAPSVYGVGVVDVDFVVSVECKDCRQYKLWRNMLERCYDCKLHAKHPSYANCRVSDEWKYFSSFLVWCNNQSGYKMKDEKGKSFALDKDVASKWNKTYSSETCNFVPSQINTLLIKCDAVRGDLPVGVHFRKDICKYSARISVRTKRKHLGYFDTPDDAFLAYKTAKEFYCKFMADFYKNVIPLAVYEALMTYTVDIDD